MIGLFFLPLVFGANLYHGDVVEEYAHHHEAPPVDYSAHGGDLGGLGHGGHGHGGHGHGGHGHGGHDDYHHGPKCRKVEREVYDDVCEPYIKKTCLTEVVQHCKDIVTPNCKAVVDTVPDKECFTVEDVACDLVEHVDYEVLPETFYVQRCFSEPQKVCDVIHEKEALEAYDKDCIEVRTSECWEEEKVVKDKQCCYSMELNCKTSVKGQDCHMEPQQDCKVIPRTVYEDKCRPSVKRVCEKLRFMQPDVVRGEKCRTESVKKCVVEQKSKPKKLKNFSYSKQCKPMPRKVCEVADREVLREKCDEVVSQVCKYKPEKKCSEEKLEHCYKAKKVVYDEVCGDHHGPKY